MPNGTGVPSLDEFLAAQRGAACSVCSSVPPDLTDEITERVARGVRVWAAFARWLNAQGHEVTGKQLQHHYSAGHHERP